LILLKNLTDLELLNSSVYLSKVQEGMTVEIL